MNRIQFLVVCLISLVVNAVYAQQDGWDISIEIGAVGENPYIGSDDYYMTPLPNLKTSYAHGNAHYSLSLLEGLDITYLNSDWGLMASVNLNVGPTRHSEEYNVLGVPVEHSAHTKRLLAGTPNLETPLAVKTMLAKTTPIGMFGVSVAIHPTSVENDFPGSGDGTHTGLNYSAFYMIGAPVSRRLALAGLFSLDFMDETYADTWYAVPRPTESLDVFAAEAGLHSASFALEATYQIAERVGLSALGAGMILRGDAKDSPFTLEPVQHTVMLQLQYDF